MKKLQYGFTTPEQSKRLLEIGVPADSADCYYANDDDAMPSWLEFGDTFSIWQKRAFGLSEGYADVIPCWSVGRLIEIWHKANRQQCSVPLSLVITHYKGASTIMKYLTELHKDGVDFSRLED